MRIAKHLSIIVVAAGCTCAVVLALRSCEASSRAQSRPSPLPESVSWKISGQQRATAVVRAARDYCRTEADSIARRCSECAVPLGQLKLVEARLSQDVQAGPADPIAIYAITGVANTGEEYLMVTAFSQAREIHRVHILARGPDYSTAMIEVRLPINSKALDAISSCYFVVDRTPWESLLAIGKTSVDAPIMLDWQEGMRVPFPQGEGVAICISVEDRLDGRSAWVPVCYFDYPVK